MTGAVVTPTTGDRVKETADVDVGCPMKADVWSLGVVLFALLSSSVPFSGFNERKILRQLARAREHLDALMFPAGERNDARFYESGEAYTGDLDVGFGGGAQSGTNVWARVSAEAKVLIRGMLEIEPGARLSIEAVVNHPWLVTKDLEQRGSANRARGLG
ncbi:hypothetical protein CLOM_g23309 [Closterium sp. NIES-68]|nr:hypothetical protein CLOM_g23309 [Closterium sp. NIES-68]